MGRLEVSESWLPGPRPPQAPPAHKSRKLVCPPLEKELQEQQNLPAQVSVQLEGESGCCLGNMV